MVLERFRLDGKAVIVTGGGRGLGRRMAVALAEAGADVAVAARTVPELEETAAAVRAAGRRCLVVPTDVRDSRQVDALVERTVAEFGRLDVFVANAGALGAAGSKAPVDVTDEEWADSLATNLGNAFYSARAALRVMLPQGSGVIITVASGTALRGFAQGFVYGAAKAGIIALTKSLAVMYARQGIRANCIVPGFVAQMDEPGPMEQEFLLSRGRYIPVGRVGRAAELGPLAVFLASDASSYVTGETFVIDGGGLADGVAPVGYAPAWEPGRQA
ncbi:MAG TPA: SDR family oxidoreductase [Dehalococcoidia bacterium]